MKSSFKAVVSSVLLVLVIVSVFVLLVPAISKFLGYSVFIVSSGSMEPVLKTGSMIFVDEVNPSEIVEGDIVSFKLGNTVVTIELLKLFKPVLIKERIAQIEYKAVAPDTDPPNVVAGDTDENSFDMAAVNCSTSIDQDGFTVTNDSAVPVKVLAR